ncbi:hypothetical protein LOTGIDRAFT_118077 [Lottia gigantea]|uniref:SMB domain-containing protein n=1 Tax=Lottia gigantea TaxID=225164 RepID=V4AH41_LOTGI|nr:hypothetical protein LOTGIDRAFT_118077 [Lottia gigantea]ESO94490.1 hypothetical protein LOTGIDRAFT_118077 [Lottia gigantea]
MGSTLNILVILGCILVPFSFSNFLEWGPDLEGPWCATRPIEQCCPGRDDECTVPILGTKCYCDIFCNETAEDCCPDFWNLCLGVTRPTPWPLTTTTSRVPINILCNVYWFKCTKLHFSSHWECSNDDCLLEADHITQINNGPYSWVASNYSDFWGLTLEDGVKYRLGTFPLGSNVVQMTPLRVKLTDVLPESFDARTKWPSYIKPIRDQGNCGASWAFSTTAVASDRLAIESLGEIKDELSAQHMLSCNVRKQKGCEGGNLDRAWWFLRKTGVVTEECYPYESGDTTDKGDCLVSRRKSNTTCPSRILYKEKRRYKATPPYRIAPKEREIMKEIMDNGPVQATFMVKSDFFMYKNGVYRYSNISFDEEPAVYHSVRIIGWGVERTIYGDILKYWICANSWGTQWGENGYFRIIRGRDECEIESYIVGVWGQISGDASLRTLLTRGRRRRLFAERSLRNLRVNSMAKGRKSRSRQVGRKKVKRGRKSREERRRLRQEHRNKRKLRRQSRKQDSDSQNTV